MRWIALQACSPEPGVANEAVQRAVCTISLGYTPRVAIYANAVVLEVSGSLRLFGGLNRLAALMKADLAQFFKLNSLPAHVLCAQAATSLIAIGRLQLLLDNKAIPKRVADMPMHTLAATHPHLAVLERIGCRTWGDLLDLPRDGVARRFGKSLLAALDQARGAQPEPYTWRVLPSQFVQKIELNALVIHATALMAGVELLLVQLHAWLLGCQSGLCALKLVWHLDPRRGAELTGEITIRTAQPAQDLKHVARLIAERLNQEVLHAPVHSMTLMSLETTRLQDAAGATASLLLETRQKGVSAVQLIERLSARLGSGSVQVWQPQASHRPEAMQRWVNAASGLVQSRVLIATHSGAAGAHNTKAEGQKHVKISQKTSPLDFACQTIGFNTLNALNPLNALNAFNPLLPSWLMAQPLKLTSRSGAPQYQGPLVKLAGPQRLEATGWLISKEFDQPDIAPAMRDYYIYRNAQGALLWIYSERLTLTPSNQVQREWYLQGVFA